MNGDALFGLATALPSTDRRRWLTAAAGVVAIAFWQIFLVSPWAYRESAAALQASTGIEPQVRDFVYFYDTLGLFPLAPPATPAGYGVADARSLLETEAPRLRTQSGYFPRHGTAGRVWLFLPYAWWTGSAENPRVAPFHAGVFIFALCAFFVAGVWTDLTPFALVLVVLIGSHPFQVFETYGRENLFSWPISTSLILLALHLPLIVREEKLRATRALPGAALLTGALIGTLSHVRSEPVILLVPAAIVYATQPRVRFPSRLAALVLLAITFVGTATLWTRYFESKTREATAIVAGAGGNVYRGPNRDYHPFWHALFCGLGDFATDRGYRWRDADAYAYALPILRRDLRAPLTEINPYCFDLRPMIPPSPGLSCDTLEVLPQYESVLRTKILSDISSDPLWYASVLAHRMMRILAEAVPVRVRVGSFVFPLPFSGFLILPALAAMVWLRAWKGIKILFFSFAASATAFAIYSSGGMCRCSTFHYFLAAMLISSGISAVRHWERP